jgi:hypothetical protein
MYTERGRSVTTIHVKICLYLEGNSASLDHESQCRFNSTKRREHRGYGEAQPENESASNGIR